MGTAIFFIQTFGLLAKDASFFGAGEFFNLDAEEASGRCLSPLSYSQRYFAKTVMTPIIMLVGVFISIPIWNKMRMCTLIKDKMSAAPAIEPIHIRRAFVNTFLFCFAPITMSSVETLVCLDTCTGDSDDCTALLMADMAVICYEGEHMLAVTFAVIVLIIVALLIPAGLLRMVRTSRHRRDISLKLNAGDVDRWFSELDTDDSGLLDSDEMAELHKRMGGALDLSTLDPDGSGSVTKEEFEAWFKIQLTSLVGTPFDVLVSNVHSFAVLLLCLSLVCSFYTCIPVRSTNLTPINSCCSMVRLPAVLTGGSCKCCGSRR